MRGASSSVDCWVAGVRRADSSSRAGAPKLAWDKKFGLWKLNPLADWSERDVWNYIHEHRLPYNPLHDRGYPFIGCTHCTQPVGPGGDLRDGRRPASPRPSAASIRRASPRCGVAAGAACWTMRSSPNC